MSILQVPSLRLSILLALGISLGRICVLSLEVWFVLVTVFSLALLALIVFKLSTLFAQFHTTVLAAGLIIIAGAMKYTADKHSLEIPENEINTDVIVVGEVITIPEISGRRAKFVVSMGYTQSKGDAYRQRLNVLVNAVRARTDTLEFALSYGMKIGLQGRLMRLSEERNPGEFSPRQYYEANGINLTMRVKGLDNVVVLDSSGGVWFKREIIIPVRTYTTTLIDQTVGGKEGEFLKGILIGERGGLTQEMKEAFANSGTAHVLAVSGSNVVVVAAFVFYLLEFLRIRKAFRIILTCLVLLLYMFLTGSQPPVVRATIMAFILMLGMLFQEKPNPMNSLGVAAIIILSIDARQLFDIGFQLSFGAVLAIIYLYPIADSWIIKIQGESAVRRAGVWLLRVCALSGVATLGTLPLTAVYFGRVSLIGILANIAVVPAVGISVILGFVSLMTGIVSLWLAETYGLVNQLLLRLTVAVAEFSGNLSNATVETFTFRWLDAFPFYSGLICAAMYAQGKRATSALVVFLLALNVDGMVARSPGSDMSNDRLRVTFLDVGQGDAILVQSPRGHTMLIDAGPRSESYDAGSRVIVPTLKRQGISTLDLLVITHPHGDHMGGADAVFDHFDVKEVVDCGRPAKSLMFNEYTEDMRMEGSRTAHATAGTIIAGPAGVRLYVLYPTQRIPDGTSVDASIPNLNNVSVVLKLCYGQVSFLFTGDAEEEAEHGLMRVYGPFLRSTVLKVGHHGSSTSTTDEFVRTVQPQHAVVSVGLFNKFNHPSVEVIRRLGAAGTEVSRTDEEGAIVFESDGKTITKVDWR